MIALRLGHLARAAVVLVAAAAPCQAQTLEKISIVIFSAPSLGAFMPPVIKARKLDQANGLDISFQERTPDAYTAQFNSGEFKVGGSASLLTVGLADSRGVKVKYLFNLFDFWGAVVTSRPEVKTLKDLEGRQLAGARATTNYVMFEFFAKKLGVDVSKIQVVNTATPGLVGYALANRADAVQIWEPAYTLLLAKKPDIRTLDMGIEATWKAFAGGSRIPYLGVGAHSDWAEQNPALVAKLYATYKAAAEWIAKNPDEAAPLLAPGASAEDVKSMARAHPQQRAARHEPRSGQRHPQGDRGGVHAPASMSAISRRCRRARRSTASRSHDQQSAADPAAAGHRQHAGDWSACGRSRRCSFRLICFPPVPDIVSRTVGILLSWPLLAEVLITAARIFAGLLGAFVLGCMMAVAIGRSPRIESYITPILVFLQGIPALSWVVIAIIWFHGIEFRIFFIMVMTTLPAFTFQILDAFRSMSEGSVRDDHVVSAAALDPVPGADRADDRAGHPHGMEGQSRQRRARGGGCGTGRRHRRGRL